MLRDWLYLAHHVKIWRFIYRKGLWFAEIDSLHVHLKGCFWLCLESVQILRIETSLFDLDFSRRLLYLFQTWNSCICSISVCLMLVIALKVRCLSLQKLSLTVYERFDLAKSSKGRACLCKNTDKPSISQSIWWQDSKDYTKRRGGGAALWKQLAAKHKHLIICNAPICFELNNVCIKLMK